MIGWGKPPVKWKGRTRLTTAHQTGIFWATPRLLLSRCLLCDEVGERAGVCDTCLGLLPPAPGAWPLAPGLAAIAAHAYRFPLDHLVHRFKFSADLGAGRWLAASLAAAVRARARPDVIVPAPSSARRLRERGFDPALLLARWVARELGCAVEARALVKPRHTPPQTALAREARERNLRGAFACRRPLTGLAVAVVDDVITTGATQRALAACALGAGAREVTAWAAAATPAPR